MTADDQTLPKGVSTTVPYFVHCSSNLDSFDTAQDHKSALSDEDINGNRLYALSTVVRVDGNWYNRYVPDGAVQFGAGRALMKLYLRLYRETVRYSDSKERLGKVCALRHSTPCAACHTTSNTNYLRHCLRACPGCKAPSTQHTPYKIVYILKLKAKQHFD